MSEFCNIYTFPTFVGEQGNHSFLNHLWSKGGRNLKRAIRIMMVYVNDMTISEYHCTAERPLLVYNNGSGYVEVKMFPHKELVEAFEEAVAGLKYTGVTVE